MFTAHAENIDKRNPFQGVHPAFSRIGPIETGKAKFRLSKQDYFKNFPRLSRHFLG